MNTESWLFLYIGVHVLLSCIKQTFDCEWQFWDLMLSFDQWAVHVYINFFHVAWQPTVITNTGNWLMSVGNLIVCRLSQWIHLLARGIEVSLHHTCVSQIFLTRLCSHVLYRYHVNLYNKVRRSIFHCVSAVDLRRCRWTWSKKMM